MLWREESLNKLQGWDGSCLASLISKSAGRGELACRGWLLPCKPYFQSGRVWRACWPEMTPAPQALFSKRHGEKSLPARDGSCPGSFISKAAGCEELAGREWLLPHKHYFQIGRAWRACWPGMAPAPEALFSIWQDLLKPKYHMPASTIPSGNNSGHLLELRKIYHKKNNRKG